MVSVRSLMLLVVLEPPLPVHWRPLHGSCSTANTIGVLTIIIAAVALGCGILIPIERKRQASISREQAVSADIKALVRALRSTKPIGPGQPVPAGSRFDFDTPKDMGMIK